jgi:hypothetical protein
MALRVCLSALRLAVLGIGSGLMLNLAASPVAAQTCNDVALVLAVDGSSSIDAGEYGFQQRAIASALRDPTVLNAMRSAGSVAVAVVFWGDAELPVQETPSVVIRSAADAERLAAIVESMPRKVLGNTGLSAGIAAALGKLETMGCAHRSIINVSGDGKVSIEPRRRKVYPHLPQARSMAEAQGVTINALTISNEVPDLAEYFEKNVITGPGAFVMNVNGYDDFADSLRRKLVREIGPQAISLAQ